MGSEYPDVLGDLVKAETRYEIHGLHYVTALEPPVVAPGEQTTLRIWLQSCWDVPLTASVSLRLVPSAPTFSIAQRRTDIPLAAAEVGEVRIPIQCASDTVQGDYGLELGLSRELADKGHYIRSKHNEGQLGKTLFTFRTGMNLSASVGLGFVAKTQSELRLSLQVAGSPAAASTPDLTPTFLSHWTVQDLSIQGKARKQIKDQQVYLEPLLSRSALYRTFLEESQDRYRDAGLPLHLGEAVFLAKILCFTVEYLLRIPHGYEALLIPAYVLAYQHDLPTSDPVLLVARADYARMTRLAMSLSFGLLRERFKRDIWSLEEQAAVSHFVSARVERPAPIPAEFLYLPLILGGLMVGRQVTMPGEDVAQSLGLLTKGLEERQAELDENLELSEILGRLFQEAKSGK